MLMSARTIRARAGFRGVGIRSLSCHATGDSRRSAAEELEQLKRDNDLLRDRLHAIQMKSSGTPELFPCMAAFNPLRTMQLALQSMRMSLKHRIGLSDMHASNYIQCSSAYLR
jgi:hypothetical protein